MDANRFDRYVRALGASRSRRGLLGGLLALVLSNPLVLLPREDVEAKGRRKRRKKRHKHQQDQRKAGRRRRQRGRCRAKPRATTCAGKCGIVKNNCKKRVDCGSCPCVPTTCAALGKTCGQFSDGCGGTLDCGPCPCLPSCPACQICNDETGVCVPNPDSVGAACDAAGQVCQSDGVCACDAGSCAACETCQGDGLCSAPCDGEGCCDGTNCLPGDANTACGAGGETCAPCAGANPLCVAGLCTNVPCTTNADCPSGALCDGSLCQPCDVCASCPFTTVQAAINAASAGDTILICAGDYGGNLAIGKSLNLIGAGDGDGAGDTILRGTGSDTALRTTGAPINLQSVRITGGRSRVGGGIRNSGTLTLTVCTITGNTTNLFGGAGIANDENATLTLDRCTVSANSSALNGGGILNGGALTLIGSTVSDNPAAANGGGIYNSCLPGETCSLSLEAHPVTGDPSIVSGNDAQFDGGGIYNNPRATVTLDAASRVTGNDANLANMGRVGGGIFNDGGTVTLANEENVTGNTPDNCGGTDLPPLCVNPP